MFDFFLKFALYLGTPKAMIMCATYFLGEWLMKELPKQLSKHKDNKLAKLLLFDFSKKCANQY